MIVNTILFEIAWMLLSVLLVWTFYAAFKMRKRTKGVSLLYALAPALIILVSIYVIPYAIPGPTFAWLQMIMAPIVWDTHVAVLLIFFALVCLLVVAIAAAMKIKAHAYAKLVGIYLAVGTSTALMVSIYGMLR